jgi:hypothetical protein
MNGNVGIGTASPGAKLEVNGSIASNSNAPLIFTSIGAGVYNKSVIYQTLSGLLIERARTTDSGIGTIIDFAIGQRG